MISVYRGSNYFEAQLLANLIEMEGLEVFLHGAALQGGVGELSALDHLSIIAYERGDFILEDDR
jgi:hypothetical protein